MICDAGEDRAEIGFRVDAAQLACFHEGIDSGGTFSAGVRSCEQPVFSSQGHHPFILPMSATNVKFIIAGIRILA